MIWVFPPAPGLALWSSSSVRSESTSVAMAEQLILVAVEEGAVSVAGDWLPESRLSDSLDATGAADCWRRSSAAASVEDVPREDWAMAPATVMTVVDEEDLSAADASGEEVEAGADPGLRRPGPEAAVSVPPPAAGVGSAVVEAADDLGEVFFCLMAFLRVATGELKLAAAEATSPLVALALLPSLCLGLLA